MSIKGRSVRLYLVDGTATGIMTAEIMNWTGHVLAAPRTRIEDAFGREEMKRTGVYFLFGPDDQGLDANRLYVGEGDDISKRIIQHNKEKNFWERVIAVTSKDMNLTKAHVRYLESRIIDIAGSAKKTVLDNKDKPVFDRLPEADIADMETFLNEIQLILPVIGADFWRKPKVSKPTAAPQSEQSWEDAAAENSAGVFFRLENTRARIKARATEVAGEFILLSGSVGSLKEKDSFHEKLKLLREEALATSRISLTGDGNFILAEDIPFSSPSAAAVFLFGASRNGRTDWIVEGQGINYGAWKQQKIDSAAAVKPAP